MTLVERLRRGPVKYFAPGGPVYEGPTLLASEAADEIERLEKAMQTAREALEPFAARAKTWDLNGDSARVSVKLGDLRRAAAAIRALQKKEG